jgi:hypothetical protein
MAGYLLRMTSERHFIIGNEIALYSFIMTFEAKRIESVATLPNREMDGQSVWIHKWEISKDGTKVSLRYSTRPDNQAPILDVELPCSVQEFQLKPPGRNYEWADGAWRNRKTGEYRTAA